MDNVDLSFTDPDTSGLDAANQKAEELASSAQTAVDNLNGLELPDISGSTTALEGIQTTIDGASDALAGFESDLTSLDSTLSGIDFSTAGGEAAQGYGTGMAGEDLSSYATSMTTGAEQAVRSAQASGSPAAAYMPIGAEAAQGYGMGMQQEDVSGYAQAFAAAAMAAVQAAVQAEAAALNLTAEGMNVIQTYATGMTAAAAMALTSMRTTGNQIRQIAQSVNLSAQGRNMLTTLTSGMNSGRSAAVSSARTTGSSIRSAFSSISLYSVGVNIVAGLRNGMNAMFGSLMATARSMAAQLRATIQSGMQVHSPSRFTEWIGEMTGQGMIAGLEGATKKVTAAAAAMALGVTSAFAPVALAEPTTISTPTANIAPVQASASPYDSVAGGTDNFSQSTNERHVVLDIRGGGRIEVSGLTKDQAVELIAEQLKPQLANILAEEIFAGGDGVYEY